MMSKVSWSLALWIKFTGHVWPGGQSGTRPAKEMRGRPEEKKRMVIKWLQLQRACPPPHSFHAELPFWLSGKAECTTGLWPIANELFSAGNGARRDGCASCSICTLMCRRVQAYDNTQIHCNRKIPNLKQTLRTKQEICTHGHYLSFL